MEYTAEQVKALRRRAGVSQEELARQLDVSTFTVSRWERLPEPFRVYGKSARALRMLEAKYAAQPDGAS